MSKAKLISLIKTYDALLDNKKKMHAKAVQTQHQIESKFKNIERHFGVQDKIDTIKDVIKRNEEKSEFTKDKSKPSWAKKLYRKIAMATHPDTRQKSGPVTSKVFDTYYVNAKIAYESYDWSRMLSIGEKLEKFPEPVSLEHLAILEYEIKKLVADVGELKNSVYFFWDDLAISQKKDLVKKALKVSESLNKKRKPGQRPPKIKKKINIDKLV